MNQSISFFFVFCFVIMPGCTQPEEKTDKFDFRSRRGYVNTKEIRGFIQDPFD
jgi:hypothetical protein